MDAELFGSLFLWLGMLFLAIGSIGILKLPDVYCRLHASGKCDTLGIFLAVIGISISLENWTEILKVVMILVFVGIANPTSTHLIGRTARQSKIKAWKKQNDS
mgnify:CR=1 FL=1